MSAVIHILLTGGTFDKDYSAASGELGFSHSHIDAIVTRCGCLYPLHVETLFLKDSLDISEADRSKIVSSIVTSDHQRIIVIHGTDTMCATAAAVEVSDKTVVFSGAMRPWALSNSDAEFNLGMAVGLVQTLDNGVYITMHGSYWSAQQVVKDRALGRFRAKNRTENSLGEITI